MSDRASRVGERILRESATGSVGATVALVAGLTLDLTMALILGAGSETDALFVALRIPLGMAVFFPSTAVQVLVPAISSWLEQNDERRRNAIVSAVLSATLILTATLALICIVLAPVLVSVLAPGLDAATQKLATDLARVGFLIIPPLAASQVLLAYRHAHRSHGLTSAAQGILAMTIVTALITAGPRANVWVAAWGYVVGGGAQLIVAWFLARARGFRFVPGRINDKEVRTIGALSLRPLAASGVQLGTRLGEQIVASVLAPGSITILHYASRLIGAVGGTLFFRPVSIAFLGPMSRMNVIGDTFAMSSLLLKGLRVMFWVSLSLASLVAIAGVPFVNGVFALGDFTLDQAALLGVTVAVYSASLPTAALQRMLLGSAFARRDTSTYLRNTIYGALANFLLLGIMALGWRPPLEVLMIPIAYSLAQLVNVFHAAWVVRRQTALAFADLGVGLIRPAGIAAAAVLVMLPLRRWFDAALGSSAGSLVMVGVLTALAGVVILGAGLWATTLRGNHEGGADLLA